MPGQWTPDPRTKSGWRWDSKAPAADPSPTNLLSGYAGAERYGHDDEPGGPPSPPLDVPAGPGPGPVGDEPPASSAPPDGAGPAIAVCPGCGGVVDAERLRT